MGKQLKNIVVGRLVDLLVVRLPRVLLVLLVDGVSRRKWTVSRAPVGGWGFFIIQLLLFFCCALTVADCIVVPSEMRGNGCRLKMVFGWREKKCVGMGFFFVRFENWQGFKYAERRQLWRVWRKAREKLTQHPCNIVHIFFEQPVVLTPDPQARHFALHKTTHPSCLVIFMLFFAALY